MQLQQIKTTGGRVAVSSPTTAAQQCLGFFQYNSGLESPIIDDEYNSLRPLMTIILHTKFVFST
jgi:hypothetical protein